MTNSLTVYENMNALQAAAQALHASGYFGDVKTQAQAMVKVMAGAEIGLPPFASMAGIHIVQGKPTLGANLIATLVKNDPRYDYRVKVATNDQCVLTWYENGAAVGESSFTMAEANAAGLTSKATWKTYASDMLFARALTRGARRYAPGIFGGTPVYTPEEAGADIDPDGHVVIEAPVTVTVTPAPVAEVPAPLADDEVLVSEAAAREFITVAAGLLETDTDAIKERLHTLGYERIPGKATERLAAYRKLKEAGAGQADLFDVAPVSNGAYTD